MKLDDLFEVRNGIASSGLDIMTYPKIGTVPFIRPASSQRRTVAGWIKKNAIGTKSIYPEGSIFVSTNGEGSHTFSYVSCFEFVPNSDVAVLIPKRDMTIQEKIYYAHCITMNRYRFSYGRKPKGDRLKRIDLPTKAPAWVISTPLREDIELSTTRNHAKLALKTSFWGPFQIQDLFEIKKGKRLTKANMAPGTTPYIGSTDSNNGVTAYIGQAPIHSGNTLSVAYNGSVAETFYQPVPFWGTDDVNVLYPKFKLTQHLAIFLVTIIRAEKYRFNYGRKWHLDRMKESIIKLPVDKKGGPDWRFMENYIKSLPYSKNLD